MGLFPVGVGITIAHDPLQSFWLRRDSARCSPEQLPVTPGPMWVARSHSYDFFIHPTSPV